MYPSAVALVQYSQVSTTPSSSGSAVREGGNPSCLSQFGLVSINDASLLKHLAQTNMRSPKGPNPSFSNNLKEIIIIARYNLICENIDRVLIGLL